MCQHISCFMFHVSYNKMTILGSDIFLHFPFNTSSKEKEKEIMINRGPAFKINAAPLPSGEVSSGRSSRWQVIDPALGTFKMDLNWYSNYRND